MEKDSKFLRDSDGNALNEAYNLYTDDLEQDYDIVPVIDPEDFTDGQVVSCTVARVERHFEDLGWQRIDVQPTIPALPEEDGNYFLECVVSGGVKTLKWTEEE